MRLSSRPSLVAVAAALVLPLLAACSTGSGSVASSGAAGSAPTVSGAWVRPAAAGGDSAGYLVITGGASADVLVSASSPGAAMVELHQTSMDSGMAGMHPVASLAVPAGGKVTLSPGGYHLMIMGVTKALAAGGSLELDLVFEHAGKVVVQAEVKAG